MILSAFDNKIRKQDLVNSSILLHSLLIKHFHLVFELIAGKFGRKQLYRNPTNIGVLTKQDYKKIVKSY